MPKYLLGANAKQFSTEVVGEQYHSIEQTLHNIAAAKGGKCELEFTLIPEPDNPYDDHAISVRYNNQVAGYIPRSRNRQLWSDITRVQASGYTPIIRGKVEAWSNGKSASITLAVGGNKNLLSTEDGLKPKKKGGYTPPPAYREQTNTTFASHAYKPSSSASGRSQHPYLTEATPDTKALANRKHLPKWAIITIVATIVLAITLTAVFATDFFVSAIKTIGGLIVIAIIGFFIWARKSQK